MNFRILLPLILLLTLVQCAIFNINKNNFFTKDEKVILEKTAKTLDYGYGFDSEVEINYLYSYKFSATDIDKKEKNFSSILKELDIDTLKAFNKKIIKLHLMTRHKMNRYKEKKEWKYYIFLQKHFFPPLDKYSNLLQNYILQNNSDPLYNKKLKKIKKETAKEIEQYYIDKEDVVDTF